MISNNDLATACREMVLDRMATHPHPEMTLPTMLNWGRQQGFTRAQTRAAINYHVKFGKIIYEVTRHGVVLSLPGRGASNG